MHSLTQQQTLLSENEVTNDVTEKHNLTVAIVPSAREPREFHQSHSSLRAEAQ